jgi:CRP-like cAMP-binding protein
MQPRRLSTPQQPRSFGNIKTSNNFTWKSSETRRTKTNIAHGGGQMSFAKIYSRMQRAVTKFLGKTRTMPIPRWISPQYHTTTISEVFGHSSFLLVAISYAVDDFVQLRLIAIGGSSAMLVFTYFHPHGRVLWLPFKWNLLFTLINSYRVLKDYSDRYFADQLDPLMQYMYDHHFYVMDKVDFALLIGLGTTETFKKGQVLVGQGDDNRYVRVVLKGTLNVERDGLITYKLHQGNFISESGLHAGLLLRGNVCSCCSVIANDDDVVVLRWDRTELMYLVEFNKKIRRALKAVMSWDIVSKLKSQRSLMASGIIEDPELWTRKRREQTLHRYRGILRNMLTHPNYLNKRKEELSKYRDIHHVDSEEHEQALKEMGWTQAEFDAGKKEGQIDEDLSEKKKHYNLTSYLKDKYQRLFE